MAWASTAQQYPATGASHRTAGLRVPTATPTPMPVNAVKSGCANGLNRHRTTKVEVTPTRPPGPMPSVPLYAAPR